MPDSTHDSGPILLVDDEAPIRHAVTQWLGLAGFETLVHEQASTAVNALSTDFPGVLVTDLKMHGFNGMDLLRHSQQMDPELPVIVITGHGDIETAVEAMRLGAYDFIEKPFAPERFLEIVRRAAEKRRLVVENRRLRRAVNEQTLSSRIIGTSKAAEALRASVAELAGTDVSVILYGDTGVGKDLVARCLHDFGPRHKANYVPVNCAAVPETMVESEFFGHEAGAFTSASKARVGKIEHASGGTLFLDEIDSMPLSTQAKLLRALQERIIERLGSNRVIPVDVRAIAASKVDLRKASTEGRFRADLYYRLSVVELTIPPLKDRIEDVPLLFEYFATSAATMHRRDARPITPTVMNTLMAHAWPGNVRELRNAAERYALGIADALLPADDLSSSGRLSLAQQVDAFERKIIERSLAEAGGKISVVMEQLDIPRRTLSEKMARFGLDRRRFIEPGRQNTADESGQTGG
jgi:two-component system, NtrC family, C4-dicarboxylate transport response regulator DctD